MTETGDTLDVEALVALYFDAIEPEERDAVFELIAARPAQETAAFMAAVREHDADPYMRAAAAGALWRMGDSAAQTDLLDLLRKASDELLCEQAMEALLQAQPHQLFDELKHMWLEEALPLTRRRLAVVGMERADAEASYAAFRAALASWKPHASVDITAMMLTALVRSGTAADTAALTALRAVLVPHAKALGDATLVDLCDEALALIAVQDAGADAGLPANQP